MKKIYEAAKEILSEKHNREELEKEAQRLSKVYNVPYEVTKHVINKETGNTWATNQVNPKSGATGIMQILPKYATNTPAGYEVDKKDLFDPYKSMNAGIKKLGQWYNTHRNKKLPEDQLDVNAAKKAMASYNAGPHGGIVKDKQGRVRYVGAATYIKTGNPTHLPLEAQNYIKDFGVENKVASNKLDKPFKRDASSIKAQIDPDEHKAVVPTVKVEPKAEPRPAVASTENPYTPGSYEYAFKQARIEGKPEFIHNGKRIAVKLKDTSESTDKMKKVYEAAKHILAEKSLKPEQGIVPGYNPPQNDWFAGARRLFSGEANPRTRKSDPDQQIKSAHANIEQTQAAKAAKEDAARRESEKKGPSKEALAAISPVPVVKKAAQAPEVKRAGPAKKELSPFEKAFAAARDKGEKEFTWYDKEGKPYQVATKLKGEVSPPSPKVETQKVQSQKSTTPKQEVNVTTKKEVNTTNPYISKSFSQTRGVKTKDQSNVVVSPEEMNDIDNQKPAVVPSTDTQTRASEKTARRAEVIDDLTKQADQPIVPAKKTDDEMKSDELWKDIRQELENETPEEKAARDARIKQYKKEWGMPTNEEKQMSINKKFNVSDSLYTAVMEVMKKPSQGSIPKTDKEKDLAAMSPPGHLITHGDVLKARGVTMKEAKKLDPVGKEDADVNNDGKVNNSDSYLKNRRKAVSAAMDESLAKSVERVGKLFGFFGDEPESAPAPGPKKDQQSVPQPNQMKRTDQPKKDQPKDKNVKEDWVDSKGKFHKEAPPPGQVPSPDEGYRPPAKRKAQPGSTTKAMEEEIVQEMSSKQKMKLGLYNKKKNVKENTDTPGNSYEHQCAIHVKSESFGEGRTITTQHADPDQNGNIAWYDVMFEHGIERYVPTAELEILVSESHMHSMKKKKRVAEETGEERNARLSRENERFKAAEAGNYQGRNVRGDVIRSGGEVVKGNPNPPTIAQRVAGKLGIPNTATDALGEPMYKSSRPTSGSSGGGMGGGGPGMAGSTSGSGLLRMMNPQKIY